MFTFYPRERYPALCSFVYVLEGAEPPHLFIPPFLEYQGNDSIQEIFGQSLLWALHPVRAGWVTAGVKGECLPVHQDGRM